LYTHVNTTYTYVYVLNTHVNATYTYGYPLRYVSGDFRFRHGYGKNNPRKMVKTWAEKEFRNLLRMHSCGMNVPKPTMLRSHVLLMEFMGVDGWASPRLKDAVLPPKRCKEAYRELLLAMRVGKLL
jgi:RIO kinase 1